jgi:Protein of unknown function (DUF3159)
MRPSGDEDLRERTRQQLIASLGGWSGTVVAAVPPLVFVAVNAATGLRPAVIAAVSAAVLAAGYRLARRQPVQQALTGLFSVVVAALIAVRSGQARDYFVLGIVTAFIYAAVFAVSLAARRPLVGLAWEYLDPTPLPTGVRWFQVRGLRLAYDLASAAALLVFVARAVVQLSLFRQNRTGWLAVARLAMGYPLYIAVIAFAFWIVRRARHRLPPLPTEPEGEAGSAAG